MGPGPEGGGGGEVENIQLKFYNLSMDIDNYFALLLHSGYITHYVFFFSAKKTSLKNKIILSSFVQSITEFGVILNNTFYILSLFSTSGITSG